MRKILITVEIEDNDLIEFNFNKWLYTNLGDTIKDYKVLTNTDELYEKDTYFQKMIRELGKQRKAVNDYINEHNFG